VLPDERPARCWISIPKNWSGSGGFVEQLAAFATPPARIRRRPAGEPHAVESGNETAGTSRALQTSRVAPRKAHARIIGRLKRHVDSAERVLRQISLAPRNAGERRGSVVVSNSPATDSHCEGRTRPRRCSRRSASSRRYGTGTTRSAATRDTSPRPRPSGSAGEDANPHGAARRLVRMREARFVRAPAVGARSARSAAARVSRIHAGCVVRFL